MHPNGCARLRPFGSSFARCLGELLILHHHKRNAVGERPVLVLPLGEQVESAFGKDGVHDGSVTPYGCWSSLRTYSLGQCGRGLATFRTAAKNESSSSRASVAITSTSVPSGSLASGGSTTTPFLTVPLALTLSRVGSADSLVILGVGEAKLGRYAAAFLEVICAHAR
jgi:hypothetical protein